MSDIVERLRRWTHSVDAAPASDLMDEAAHEIERLRGSTVEQRFCEPPVAGSTPAAGLLTDAEREAVRFCVTASLPETEKLGGVAGELCRMHAARLRGLLDRTQTAGK